MKYNYVIGVDFGTDSVRSVLLDCNGGREIAASVFNYPRWQKGLYCNPGENRFRQHPLDYIEGLEASIKDCLKQAGPEAASHVRGISVDTTGSTPVAIDETGTPLALKPGFEENPNAMFILWKDHTSVAQAARINLVARDFETDYLQYVGGIYSSEWFWAKLLQVLKTDEAVRKAIYSWVEHCDWVPFLLTGGKSADALKRGVCSAGHKSLYAETFGGLPPNDFFVAVDPLLDGFTGRLFKKAYTADQEAGKLSARWAERLGLSEEVVVGIGAFDCHMGAVGAQIEPYLLSKIIGTSTCDIMVVPTGAMQGALVQGICGQVPGSVIPGMTGLEAGQSAFGDVYAWFKQILMWPLKNFDLPEEKVTEIEAKMLAQLSEEAAATPVREDSVLALDWLNGRRTPDANQLLTASICGLSLSTGTVDIFRSLVEATCFGAKAIAERFVQQGIAVKGLIAMGGVARKSPYIMQTMADVIGMPIKVHKSEQTCAAGAAMFAATAAGVFDKVEDAMGAMGQGFDKFYEPNPSASSIYQRRYERYQRLGEFTESELSVEPATNELQPQENQLS